MGVADHLRASNCHGRLTFHGSCPICRRERLFGTRPSDTILSGRNAAGVLAIALALPSAGIVPVAALADGPPAKEMAPPPNPFDDAGGSSDGGVEDGPTTDGDVDPDRAGDGPISQTPASEQAVPEAPSDNPLPSQQTPDGEGEQGAPTPPPPTTAEPPAPVPLVPPPAAPLPSAKPVPEPPSTNIQTPTPPPPPSAPLAWPSPEHNQAGPVDQPESSARIISKGESGPGGALGANSPGDPRTLVAGPRGSGPPPSSHGRDDSDRTRPAENVPGGIPQRRATPRAGAPKPAATGARRVTVRQGQSLWSIARGQLGPAASPAEISHLVSRLWSLNAARIASGDPSLIRTGQTLLIPTGGA